MHHRDSGYYEYNNRFNSNNRSNNPRYGNYRDDYDEPYHNRPNSYRPYVKRGRGGPPSGGGRHYYNNAYHTQHGQSSHYHGSSGGGSGSSYYQQYESDDYDRHHSSSSSNNNDAYDMGGYHKSDRYSDEEMDHSPGRHARSPKQPHSPPRSNQTEPNSINTTNVNSNINTTSTSQQRISPSHTSGPISEPQIIRSYSHRSNSTPTNTPLKRVHPPSPLQMQPASTNTSLPVPVIPSNSSTVMHNNSTTGTPSSSNSNIIVNANISQHQYHQSLPVHMSNNNLSSPRPFSPHYMYNSPISHNNMNMGMGGMHMNSHMNKTPVVATMNNLAGGSIITNMASPRMPSTPNTPNSYVKNFQTMGTHAGVRHNIFGGNVMMSPGMYNFPNSSAPPNTPNTPTTPSYPQNPDLALLDKMYKQLQRMGEERKRGGGDSDYTLAQRELDQSRFEVGLASHKYEVSVARTRQIAHAIQYFERTGEMPAFG